MLETLALIFFSSLVVGIGFIVLYKLYEFLWWLEIYQYRKIKYKHYIRLSDDQKKELNLMVVLKKNEEEQKERKKRKNKWGF